MFALPFLRPSTIAVAALSLSLLAPVASFAQAAQSPELTEGPAPRTPRVEQKVERLHVADEGTSIDEVRYGGQTQSISVQPKANVPGYEVLPNDGGRERQGAAETSSGGNGPRVWNVMKF